MRRAILWTMTMACILAMSAPQARAAEKKITREQLPPAVRKIADEQSQGASVRGYAREVEDGHLQYEVSMTLNGHSRDVAITPDGTLLEVEEEVSLDALAPEVRSGLTAQAKGGQITKVESITKRGMLVAYEAQLIKSGKHAEVQVGPQGQPLDHEE